jgi:O-antigen/teichoic acid export membrane protein
MTRSQNKTAFLLLLGRLLLIGLALGGLGIGVAFCFGREILSILYTAEYAEYAGILLWVMLSATFSYLASFLGYGMTATRSFKAQLPLVAFVTMCTCIASLWLIPWAGLVGAVMATMFSLVVQCFGSWWVNWRALSQVTR